jgi:transcriptional regulator with XRE-family HTH domain
VGEADGIGRRVDWGQWMRGLGANARRLREQLGLTQQQLADIAGVSQGAISRLELGVGLATPFLVVFRVHVALRDLMARLDPAILSEDARKLLEIDLRLGDGGESSRFTRVPIFSDPNLTALLDVFRRIEVGRREQFLAVVESVAAAFTSSAQAAPLERPAALEVS